MTDGAGFRYDRPPVRNVKLTVHFEPLTGLGIGEVAALHALWSKEYPSVRQSGPQVQRWEGFRRSVGDRFGGWALPYVEYTDPTLTKTIAYQADRFTLNWSFGGSLSGHRYPGYAALSKELHRRFHEFISTIEESLDKDLSIRACECLYRNSLDDVLPREWVVGYLTGWKETCVENSSKGELNLRISDEDTVDDVERRTRIWLAPTQQNQGSRLSINVIATKPKASRPQFDELMDTAHAKLIDVFEDSASTGMKEVWGLHA